MLSFHLTPFEVFQRRIFALGFELVLGVNDAKIAEVVDEVIRQWGSDIEVMSVQNIAFSVHLIYFAKEVSINSAFIASDLKILDKVGCSGNERVQVIALDSQKEAGEKIVWTLESSQVSSSEGSKVDI